MDTKKTITKLIADYIALFPTEWEQFKKAHAIKIKDQFNKWAKPLKGVDTIERALFEIPETLDTMFMMQLSEEDKKWFYSKKGSHWFITNFKEFKLTYEA